RTYTISITNITSRLRPTLFPYTTLFRSFDAIHRRINGRKGAEHARHLDALFKGHIALGVKGVRRSHATRHPEQDAGIGLGCGMLDRKSTRLNSSHVKISYAVFCLKKKRR